MNRRTFLKGAAAGLGLAALNGWPAWAEGDRPNIILVMADDQGWGDMGYCGHQTLKTPCFDAMAKEGLRFDRFYAAAPVCSPTRGSCLTGRHPVRYGVFSWGYPLRPQEITLAEALKTAGYATGHFGKWHLGSVLKESPVSPGGAGFDEWTSGFNYFDINPLLSENGVVKQYEGESSAVTVDAALPFIRKHAQAKKPFFAVIWFGSPHLPHKGMGEDLRQYAGQAKEEAAYFAEITAMDRAFGKLREELKTLGIRDNTILWYTSDNGGKGKASATGGRGEKGQVYEGGLRVPAILEWPARIKAPRVTNVPCVTSDFYPTLLEVTGVSVPKQPPLDGVSLVPLIDGKMDARPKPIGFWDYGPGGLSTPSDEWCRKAMAAQKAGQPPPKELLFADAGDVTKQYPEDRFPGHAAWLDGTWKLHGFSSGPIGPAGEGGAGGKKGAKGKGKGGGVELYDLAADPQEAKDLAGDAAQAERVKTMTEQLRAWQASVVRSLNGKDY